MIMFPSVSLRDLFLQNQPGHQQYEHISKGVDHAPYFMSTLV